MEFSRNKKKGRLFRTAVFSLTILIVSAYSSSPVQAYFNQEEDQEMGFQMGSWWDGSKLGFEQSDIEKPFTACSSVNLPFSIRNSGFGMIGSTAYRIYKDDKIIAEGTLGQIGANQTGHLSIETDQPGIYYAEVDQRPGYEGNEKETVRSASPSMTVADCPPPPKKENKKKSEKKETKPDVPEEKKTENDPEMNEPVREETSKKAETPEEEPVKESNSEEPEKGEGVSG